MSTNEAESPGSLFKSAQDALLGALRWGATRGRGRGKGDGAASRILDGQEQAIRMMSAMSSMWVEMAKQGVTGPDGVRAFMERFQKELPPMGSHLPNAETLRQMMSMWQTGGQEYLRTMMPALGGFGVGPDATPDALRETVYGFATSPGFGLTREYQAKVGKTFEAWLTYQQRDLDYRTLLSRAWTDAFSRVMQAMAERASKGESPKTAREALEMWIDIADETFIALFKTDEFSKTQSALMNASMALKKSRRELMEDALVASDLPTRRELDEAHRMIYLLRKELKAVKRQLNELVNEKREALDGR